MGRGTIKFIALVVFIIGAFLLAREYGAEYLDEVRLRAMIEGYGALAPLAYMLIYILSACLMLPGLPITVIGGVLFGPFWGSVYVSIGATVGAALAFLIARRMGKEWVEGLMKGERLTELYSKTEERGWKIVAFTRLIPIFPYNFLNYAFGLTRIRFSHYIIASFVFMLPGIVAYVVFSSSILALMRGRVSTEFLIGLSLILIISLIPALYRRLRRKRSGG